MITQAQLVEMVDYEPDSGQFRWRRSGTGRKPSGEVGALNTRGYLQTRIGGADYLLHRLAWLYVFGEWPSGHLDHINRNRSDNRISNLRECDAARNQQNVGVRRNNRTGYTGVSWSSRDKKYVAQIRYDGRNNRLGFFDSAEEAAAAYAAARALHHEFADVRYVITDKGRDILKERE